MVASRNIMATVGSREKEKRSINSAYVVYYRRHIMAWLYDKK